MTVTSPDFPAIQRRMKRLGYYEGAIDDDWGPGMRGGIERMLAIMEEARGIQPPQWPELPDEYAWLRDVGAVPRHLAIALNLLGTVEVAGPGNSAIIMGWREELVAAGVDLTGYNADSVAWCGLFMCYVMHKAEREPVAGPLWALNWGKFGEDGGQPELGDVLTFKRQGGGHVAIYIAEDRAGYYHILGGNQSDRVNIMRIDKDRMHACRQPPYRTKPASVKPYVVAPGGTISRNEA